MDDFVDDLVTALRYSLGSLYREAAVAAVSADADYLSALTNMSVMYVSMIKRLTGGTSEETFIKEASALDEMSALEAVRRVPSSLLKSEASVAYWTRVFVSRVGLRMNL